MPTLPAIWRVTLALREAEEASQSLRPVTATEGQDCREGCSGLPDATTVVVPEIAGNARGGLT